MIKRCVFCRREFEDDTGRRKYCSSRCRKAAFKERHGELEYLNGDPITPPQLIKLTVEQTDAIEKMAVDNAQQAAMDLSRAAEVAPADRAEIYKRTSRYVMAKMKEVRK